MSEQIGELLWKNWPQNDDRRVDAGLPKRDPFLDRHDGDTRHPLAKQRFGRFDGAMAIGVCFDDGHDVAAGNERFTELGQVVDQCGQID